MQKIIIVEDDLYMREELEYMFQKEGYETLCMDSFEHAIDDIIAESPELVVLDVNLPGTTGFEICRKLKQRSNIPVLILTSRDQLKDELHALGLGADEFLTKPCHKERLLARVSNLLRHYEGRGKLVGREGFLLDRQTYTLYWKEQSVILPENQGKILDMLLTHWGETVAKETLCEMLWGTTEYIDENALQVNMTRLKKSLLKLGADYKVIAIRGVGYKVEADG